MSGASNSSGSAQRASDSRNVSAEKAYANGQGRSLLCHPLGVLLLEDYGKFVRSRDIDEEVAREFGWYPSKLQSEVQKVLVTFDGSGKTETSLTDGLFRAFERYLPNHVYQQELRRRIIYGWEGSVTEDCETSGKLDIAFGRHSNRKVDSNPGASMSNAEKKTLSEEKRKHRNDLIDKDVVGILEASVDGNGGLKKLAQGVKYAAIMCGGQVSPPLTNLGQGVDSNQSSACEDADIDMVDGGISKASEDDIDVDMLDETLSLAPTPEKERHIIVWTLHVQRSDQKSNTAKRKGPLGTEGSKAKQQKHAPDNESGNGPNNDPNNEPNHEPNNEQDKKRIHSMAVDVCLCEISLNQTHNCPQAKYALLWREFTEIPTQTRDGVSVPGDVSEVEWKEAIEKGARSIVRAVATVSKLSKYLEAKTADRFSFWELKGPNCVKVKFPSDCHYYMLKVFDNRFFPTARSPFLWCNETLCDPRLEVEPFFLLREGCVVDETNCTHDFLYLPVDQKGREGATQVLKTIRSISEDGRGTSGEDGYLLGNPCYEPLAVSGKYPAKYRIPFGTGAIVILRYKYIEGSHWPETTTVSPRTTVTVEEKPADDPIVPARLGCPRSFIPILDRLKILHKHGYVHGDVRLFNMIFAKSNGDGGATGGAYLLDYDLGGKEQNRKYPWGYTSYLADVGSRAGTENLPLCFRHDLVDFLGVIELFELHSEFLNGIPAKLENLHNEKDEIVKRERDLVERERDLVKWERDLVKRERDLRTEKEELLELLVRDKDLAVQEVRLTSSVSRSLSEEVEKTLADLRQNIAATNRALREVQKEIDDLQYDTSMEEFKRSTLRLEEQIKKLKGQQRVVGGKIGGWKDRVKTVKRSGAISGATIDALLNYHKEITAKCRGENSDDDDVDPGLFFTASFQLRSIVKGIKESKTSKKNGATSPAAVQGQAAVAEPVEVATGSPDRILVTNGGKKNSQSRASLPSVKETDE